VAPGPTDTGMLNQFTGTAERKAALADTVPLGRVGQPAEIAPRRGLSCFRKGIIHHRADSYRRRRKDLRLVATQRRRTCLSSPRTSATVIKIVDCWTVRDGRVTSIWVAYFEPQALLDKLGIAHGLGR
jgi:hypothetical protein